MTEQDYDAKALDFCTYCGEPADILRPDWAVCEYCAILEQGECCD